MHATTPQGSPRPASFNPLETNVDSRHQGPAWEARAECPDHPVRGVHHRHHRKRAAILRALRDGDDPALTRRADRIRYCCSSPHIRVCQDGSPALVLGRCRDRLCPLCSDFRGRECAARLADLIRRMNAPRFVTITLRNSAEPLAAQVDRLFLHFRALRATPWWKSKVRGGVYSLEVTRNAATGTWHPHLHLVCDGEYLPQRELASLWERITGDSRVVWIEAIHDAQKTAKYVATYVNTPPDVHTWGDEPICEYAIAMHGRRVLHSFGSCHGANIDAAREKEAPPASRAVCSVRELVERACSGNAAAERACDYLIRMGGFWSAVAAPLLPFDPTGLKPLDDAERKHFARLCVEAFTEEPPQPPPKSEEPMACGPLLFEMRPIHD